jgi:hypothetical protein
MPWSQHQQEIGMLHVQAAIDCQESRFLPFVCASTNEQTSPLHQRGKRMLLHWLLCGEQRPINIGIPSHLYTLCYSPKAPEAIGSLC